MLSLFRGMSILYGAHLFMLVLGRLNDLTF